MRVEVNVNPFVIKGLNGDLTIAEALKEIEYNGKDPIVEFNLVDDQTELPFEIEVIQKDLLGFKTLMCSGFLINHRKFEINYVELELLHKEIEAISTSRGGIYLSDHDEPAVYVSKVYITLDSNQFTTDSTFLDIYEYAKKEYGMVYKLSLVNAINKHNAELINTRSKILNELKELGILFQLGE